MSQSRFRRAGSPCAPPASRRRSLRRHLDSILEIYADRAAYESHLQTPHFRKYKQGTLSMVRELELVDVNPLLPGLKIK